MRKLFDAGMRVFAERGYHAARVDDIVRAARTSHGTFYLYFANKEDLLRALAVDCADDLAKLADRIGPITPDEQGFGELRAFLAEFVATYRRYGPVIRAWMEDQVADPEIDRVGVATDSYFEHIVERLREDPLPTILLDPADFSLPAERIKRAVTAASRRYYQLTPDGLELARAALARAYTATARPAWLRPLGEEP